MRRVFVCELKSYSINNIAQLMGVELDCALDVIRRLLVAGIVYYLPSRFQKDINSALNEMTNDSQLYQFNWVGLALVEEWIFICYPKYLRADELSNQDIEQHMKLILQILRRDEDTACVLQMSEYGLENSNKLPIMLQLLELFDNYGEYSNYELIYENNGAGSIEWNRTVGRHNPLLSLTGQPIYTELKTRKKRRNESDFITRLHRAVLSQCFQLIDECGISEMLGISTFCLSDEEINELGDNEELLLRIERERSVQFVTWKQNVLDVMSLYLSNHNFSVEYEEVQSLGTSHFYHIWEDVCKVAFGDLLDKKLKQLPLSLADNWIERSDKTLLNIIPRPKWERINDSVCTACAEVDTLIPDAISFFDNHGVKTFCIYDAKYYVPSESGKMVGQPGVESVVKQFLYQSAYRDFVLDHGFQMTVNAFLIPGNIDRPYKMARVSFPGVFANEMAPFSNYVDMWILPAEHLYKAYLNSKKLDTATLSLINNPF